MPQAQTPTTRKLIRFALMGVAIVTLVSVAVVLFTVTPETVDGLRELRREYLALAAAMILVSWICSGARVWVLARSMGHPVSFRQAMQVALSFEFGVVATPAGVGGAPIRIGLLHRCGIPLARATSMFAADMTIDFLFFVLLAPLTILVIARDEAWQQILAELPRLRLVPALTGLVLLGVLIAGIVVAARYGAASAALARNPLVRRYRLRGRWRRLKTTLKRDAVRSWDATLFLLRHRRAALTLDFVLACAQWMCRYGVLPVLVLSMSCRINPFPLILMQGLLFAISVVLVAPGGGGGVEILTAVILPFFVAAPMVGVVLFLWRLFTYHLYLLGGGATFVLTVRDAPLPTTRTAGETHD